MYNIGSILRLEWEEAVDIKQDINHSKIILSKGR